MRMVKKTGKIAALIVTYNPDRRKIQCLIDAIHVQVSYVVVIDNGSPPDISQYLRSHKGVTYLPMSQNRGIGAALNTGLRHAETIGCSHIITFDQDSLPDANMVEKLLFAYGQLRADGCRVAAVGPTFVDCRQTPHVRYPFYRKSGWQVKRIFCADEREYVEVDALITSGCLYPLEVFKDIKLFDEDYFVDYIDTDWCFYARSLGFRLFGICGATMSHELGCGDSRSFAGIRLIEYSALRRYYYFRNTIEFVRRAYVSCFWKGKLSLGLILRVILLPVSPGAHKWRQLAMMFKGIVHGLSGITGPISENVDKAS